jgi:hypothetical protein
LLTEDRLKCPPRTADRITESSVRLLDCSPGQDDERPKLSRTDKDQDALAFFDAEPMLLNTPDGVVDLTGSSVPARLSHDQGDPGGSMPWQSLWLKFWTRSLGNKELIKYLQRMAGYCLTS